MKKIKSHKRKNLIVISVTTGEKDLAEKRNKKDDPEMESPFWKI